MHYIIIHMLHLIQLTKEEMEMSNGDNPISISNGSSNTTPTSVNPTNGDTTDTPDGGGSSQVDILVTPIKATPPPRVSAPYYTVDSDGSLYNLEFIHSQTDIDRMKASRNLAMTPTKSSQRVHIETPVDDSGKTCDLFLLFTCYIVINYVIIFY